MLKIGDKVTVRIYALNDKCGKPLTGTVVGFHHDGRFFRVRLDRPGGSYYECFLLTPGGNPR